MSAQQKIIAAPSLWTGPFIKICVLNLLMFLGFHMLGAPFPFFIKDLGGDEALAGLAAGMFSVASVIMRPIVGWVLDNKGRRVVLIVGLVGMVIMPLAYSVLPFLSIVIIMRLLHGVVWSCATTSSNTVVCDMLPRERFGEGMGYFGLTTALSTAISPVIGLALMNNRGFPALFVVSASLALLALLATRTISYAPLAPHLRSDFLHSIRQLINKDALPAAAVMLLFMIPYGGIMTFIALFAAESGLSHGGLFFVLLAVTTFLMRLTTGKLVDKRGEYGLILSSTGGMFVALLLLAFVPGLLSYFAAATLIGAGFGMMTPCMQSMAMHLATPERRGSASSTYLCAFDAGIGLGGALAGVLVKFLGYPAMFMLMSLFVLLSMATYLLWGVKHPSSFTYQMRRQQK